jgi:hypothetical protein
LARNGFLLHLKNNNIHEIVNYCYNDTEGIAIYEFRKEKKGYISTTVIAVKAGDNEKEI